MFTKVMRVVLRRNKDKQLRNGYPWAFANQIERIEGTPETGDVVEIAGAEGHVYGLGLYHASSLIAVRFLTSDPARVIDASFFRERVRRAWELRASIFGGSTHYRVIFSESDGLPGTIVDRYGDVLTWSCLSYGMAQRREWVLDALEEFLHPSAIVERNDALLRAKDELPESTGILRGTLDGPVTIEEEGVSFEVDVLNGPKTGFFIDQRLNRRMVGAVARGRRVLDVFCADGGFGLLAAAGGAQEVHMVDVSASALERVAANAARNGLAERVRVEQADALDHLGALVREGARYDLIVLDPPAFAKSRRQIEQATKAYQRINITALQMLEPGGILATASCSQAISEADFVRIVEYSARRAGAALRLLYRGTQPPDHPVLESMPETQYLKFFLFQKLGDEVPGA